MVIFTERHYVSERTLPEFQLPAGMQFAGSSQRESLRTGRQFFVEYNQSKNWAIKRNAPSDPLSSMWWFRFLRIVVQDNTANGLA
jgi:hypothetical protein